MLSKHGGHCILVISETKTHDKVGEEIKYNGLLQRLWRDWHSKWTTNHHLYKWGIQVVVGIQKDHIEVAQRLDQLDLPLSLKGRVVALDLVLGTNTKGKGFLHCFIVGTYAPWNPLQSIKLLAWDDKNMQWSGFVLMVDGGRPKCNSIWHGESIWRCWCEKTICSVPNTVYARNRSVVRTQTW